MDHAPPEFRERVSAAPPGRIGPWQALTQMRRGEGRIVLLSALTLFCTFAGYYVLRPIRDEISANDRDILATLWTVVFFVMLAVVPLYTWLTGRWPRRKFVPFVFHFAALNILVFYLLFVTLPETSLKYVDRVFYVWVSVFNLMVVSVFWQMMADTFNREQSTRLFGLIAVGGTVGAICGPAVVWLLLTPPAPLESLKLDYTTLLFAPILLLEAACGGVFLLNRAVSACPVGQMQRAAPGDSDRPLRGSVWQGLAVILCSRYLLLICAFIVLMSTIGSFLYFQQADILRAEFSGDRDGRRALLAQIDTTVNVLALLIQLFVVGRIMSRVRAGVGVALAILPIVAMLGFGMLALGHTAPDALPLLSVFVAFQVGQRTAKYALAKPARETLFTVVPRDQKYKAKAFIDAAVYRGADTASGWVYTGLQALGLGLVGLALVAIPIAGLWLVVGFTLGRMQQHRAETPGAPANDARVA